MDVIAAPPSRLLAQLSVAQSLSPLRNHWGCNVKSTLDFSAKNPSGPSKVDPRLAPHHSSHQMARTARPKQAIIMPHNVAVDGSNSGRSARSSGCSSGVTCRCHFYVLVRVESTPFASELTLLPSAR